MYSHTHVSADTHVGGRGQTLGQLQSIRAHMGTYSASPYNDLHSQASMGSDLSVSSDLRTVFVINMPYGIKTYT